MKRVIAGLLLLIIVFAGCSQNTNAGARNAKPLIYVWIDAPFSPSYGFVLQSDGELVVYRGKFGFDSLKSGDLDSIESKNAFLNHEEFGRLKNSIDVLGEIDDGLDVTDYWEYCVTVHGRTYYNCTYGLHKNYDSIIKELIRLSPIAVVGESGDKIIPVQDSFGFR